MNPAKHGLEDIAQSELVFDNDPAMEGTMSVTGAPDDSALSRLPADSGIFFEFVDPQENTDDLEATSAGPEARSESEPESLSLEDSVFEQANRLARNGYPQDAVEVLRGLLRNEPRHAGALSTLGVLYDEMGAHDLAVIQFEAARALDPNNPEVLSNLAAALGAQGKFEEAEVTLREALQLGPDNLGARANLGILMYRKGLYQQAADELRWVCVKDSEHGPAHYYRGEALNRLGQYERAMEALREAIRLQPKNSKAHYTMGILYDRRGMPQEAGTMYRKARELTAAAKGH